MTVYGVGSSNSPIVIDDSSDEDSVDARQVIEQLGFLAGSGSGVSRTPSVIALDDYGPEGVDPDNVDISNGIGGGRGEQGEGDIDNDGGSEDEDWEQDADAEQESGDEDLADFMEKWLEEGEDSERTWMTVRNGGYRILVGMGYQHKMGLGPRLEGAFFRCFFPLGFFSVLSFFSILLLGNSVLKYIAVLFIYLSRFDAACNNSHQA